MTSADVPIPGNPWFASLEFWEHISRSCNPKIFKRWGQLVASCIPPEKPSSKKMNMTYLPYLRSQICQDSILELQWVKGSYHQSKNDIKRQNSIDPSLNNVSPT